MNPFNNVALYDPANPDINIIDLDAQAYVAWELNNNGGVPYTGVRTATGHDDIWHYQRNYFNGEAPDLAYFEDIFGDDLAGLTEEGASAGGWNLMDQGVAVYHCGNNGDTCFKFTNDATGQEYVYIDGQATNDVAVLGTYNYGGSADLQHVLDDMSPYWTGGNGSNDPTELWNRLFGGDAELSELEAYHVPVMPQLPIPEEQSQ